MKTATTTKLVSKTAAEVQAHNSKHSQLIELGMMEAWEQTESAKREEAKTAIREAKAKKEAALYETAKATITALNEKAAHEQGLVPLKLSVQYHYASTGSYFREGPLDGVTVEFSYDKRRTYKFNKANQLNTGSLERALKEHYSIAAADYARKAEKLAKIEAARSEMSNELLDKIAKLVNKRFEELTITKQDTGKIAVTYTHYSTNGYGTRRTSSYPMNVFSPLTVAQWEKWVAIQEAHKQALSALLEEAKA